MLHHLLLHLPQGFIIIDSLTPRACPDLDLPVPVHVPMYYKSKLMHLKYRYHIVRYRYRIVIMATAKSCL